MAEFDFLKNPFDDTSKDFQTVCFDIAKNLFCNYGIKCGEKIFRFAEIEFYYYEKGKWEEDWNKVTYPRNNYEAGELFFHLSGMDICFDSSFVKRRFGGILVRSIVGVNRELIAGPLNSMLRVLNASKKSQMPCLYKLEMSLCIDPKPALRALGEKDMENFEDNNTFKLCFYDATIPEWKTKKERYLKNQKGVDDVVKVEYYKYNRFN
ncbi:MAG: hypothetical protein K6F33_00605 [Bacteroidales bacterium]|nr:hypothetical protein [Bacteroidales bacterium]